MERRGQTQRIDFDSAALKRLTSLAAKTRKGIGSLVFVVGEPGMGKTYLSQRLMEYVQVRGGRSYSVSLMGKTGEQVSKLLARLVRNETMRTTANMSAIVIDDYPPTEECDLSREASLLRRLVSFGSLICVCMRPEAVLIAEEMPDIEQIRANRLCVPREHFEEQDRPWIYGHGVPALHAALGVEELQSLSDALPGHTYQNTLRSLAMDYLRPGLPAEEARLRLAMFLLGEGSSEELSHVVSRVEQETLLGLQEEAPLFRIDVMRGTFSSVGYDDDAILGPALPVLVGACDGGSLVARNAAILLARREQYRRSALVASHCLVSDRVWLVSTWGIEYLCVGFVRLVRDAIADAGRVGADLSEGIIDARCALRLIEVPASDLDTQQVSVGLVKSGARASFSSWSDVTRRRRHLELMRACRDLDCGHELGKVVLRRDEDDELSQAFISHLEARSLLLSGEITRAYGRLVNEPHRFSADTAAAALLCDDFEVASLLLGEEPSEQESMSFRRAREFLAGMGVRRLEAYRKVLDQWVSAMVGKLSAIEGIESAIACAERMGDVAVRSCLLVGAAMCDLRIRQYPRAHVRALQAVEASTALGPYLHQSSRLIDALACLRLGDESLLVNLACECVNPTVVRSLAVSLAHACCSGEEAQSLVAADSFDHQLDHDILWLVNLLCNDLDEISVAFRGEVPDSWSWASKRAARKAMNFSQEFGTEKTAQRATSSGEAGEAGSPISYGEERPIKIRVLGGFYVSVMGEPLSLTKLGRRRASALIACLAAHETHRMTRLELVESIWPERSYDDALQRLYEATSLARTSLGAQKLGVDPFASDRSEGILGLNTDLMTIDVDEFVRKSRRVVATKDDDLVLELAADALGTYAGDLFVSTYDARGVLSLRKHELQELFADVSVTAARAAMREDRPMLAAQLARKAHDVCPMREDVVLVLVEALKIQGARQEAGEAYQDFARLLVERTGMLPSNSLRCAVEEVVPRTMNKPVTRRKKKSSEHAMPL